jgi:GR25 family glycosyltransferase involved in LPS biosynthesis
MSANIDHIFYINLDKRTDRRAEIETELSMYNLVAERYSAIHTPESGIVGCGYSHLNVLKLAKERGYRNVLICEDDLEFVISKGKMEALLGQFFDLNIEYDVVMLSYIVQVGQETEYDFLGKVIDGQTACCYLVNQNYYDTLINLYSWAIPLLEQTNAHWLYSNDLVWKNLQPDGRWYYFKPRIGRQRTSYSDNKMCMMENPDGCDKET